MGKDTAMVREWLSKDVIVYLHDVIGDTCLQIGGKIGLSEAYVNRVFNGRRGLRMEYLVKIKEAYGIPLPLLLSEAIKIENVPEGLRPLHKAARELLESGQSLKKVLEQDKD